MNGEKRVETTCDGQGKPLVSIITPTYNREVLLRATIESVLAQTYPRVEYIVVDDGSVDGTREVCARYPAVRYLYQRNAGQSSAINAGWAQASGKYLMYLSSDDLLKPAAIAEMVALAENGGGVVVVYPDYEVIDETGRHLGNKMLGPFREDAFFFDLKCLPGPGALFSRALFDKYGGWDRRLRQVPDYEYWLRLSADAQMVNLPRVLAVSRVHAGAISYSTISVRRSLEVVRLARRYIVPRARAHRRRLLAKAYTVSMRYQLRTGQFLQAARFARKIWLLDKVHLASAYFIRAVVGELYRVTLGNARK